MEGAECWGPLHLSRECGPLSLAHPLGFIQHPCPPTELPGISYKEAQVSQQYRGEASKWGWGLFPRHHAPQTAKVYSCSLKPARGNVRLTQAFSFRKTGQGDGGTSGFNECPPGLETHTGLGHRRDSPGPVGEGSVFQVNGEDLPNITNPF